jgi:hypothetical protein
MATSPDHFELTLSLPHDVRLAATVRGLAVQAAHYAGCSDAKAEAFGRSVEELARTCLADAAASAEIAVVVRRAAGPLEVRIATRTITLDV